MDQIVNLQQSCLGVYVLKFLLHHKTRDVTVACCSMICIVLYFLERYMYDVIYE